MFLVRYLNRIHRPSPEKVRQFGLELLDDVHEVVIDAVADADAIEQRIEPFC